MKLRIAVLLQVTAKCAVCVMQYGSINRGPCVHGRGARCIPRRVACFDDNPSRTYRATRERPIPYHTSPVKTLPPGLVPVTMLYYADFREDLRHGHAACCVPRCSSMGVLPTQSAASRAPNETFVVECDRRRWGDPHPAFDGGSWSAHPPQSPEPPSRDAAPTQPTRQRPRRLQRCAAAEVVMDLVHGLVHVAFSARQYAEPRRQPSAPRAGIGVGPVVARTLVPPRAPRTARTTTMPVQRATTGRETSIKMRQCGRARRSARSRDEKSCAACTASFWASPNSTVARRPSRVCGGVEVYPTQKKGQSVCFLRNMKNLPQNGKSDDALARAGPRPTHPHTHIERLACNTSQQSFRQAGRSSRRQQPTSSPPRKRAFPWPTLRERVVPFTARSIHRRASGTLSTPSATPQPVGISSCCMATIDGYD